MCSRSVKQFAEIINKNLPNCFVIKIYLRIETANFIIQSFIMVLKSILERWVFPHVLQNLDTAGTPVCRFKMSHFRNTDNKVYEI